MPGSPLISSRAASPARARSSNPISRCNSSERPTIAPTRPVSGALSRLSGRSASTAASACLGRTLWATVKLSLSPAAFAVSSSLSRSSVAAPASRAAKLMAGPIIEYCLRCCAPHSPQNRMPVAMPIDGRTPS